MNTTLAFDLQRQSQTNWAWAAVAVSIARFYNPRQNFTQCSLACWAFDSGNCCDNPVSPACNKPYSLDNALQHTFNLNITREVALSFDEVLAQLQRARPVCVQLQWTGQSGSHLCVIYGCNNERENERTYTIADPYLGKRVVLAADFPRNYGEGGTWTHTYLTKPD